jgi:excisionase family DNA binding protein
MNIEPWVTAEHVAQHLGVVKDTVYRWRERKGLPAHKIGRLWKFQLSAVNEWVRVGGADEDTKKRAKPEECTHDARNQSTPRD